ncbi:hypothetical protein DOTSEDRAFT_180378 [Dothistroma septosporum NZE10]|uniref:Mitochondrial distribution and morphology protein family 31/32 n=1 Tax=Dothistroma septosporum (strain NZE10 / CBS 128990) TaxID=675120 RepID=M2YLF3_DOTSN|nr:hypothetical protein DOTSEDRAFT_180378 [Dothistroma septosporum NZE10]
MKLVLQRRWSSDQKSPAEDPAARGAGAAPGNKPAVAPPKTTENASNDTNLGEAHNWLSDRLPAIHRPTKEELLAAATGFWHRLQIRFKWFSIRSVRPFTMDEIFAFMSWIFWGHVLWLIIGTTTFVSLAIWAVNTVFAQETLAGWIGNYLTKSSGIQVVFESAVVPRWGAGVIRFNNVFVSRRPERAKMQRSVTKGSSTTAAAEAAAAMQAYAETQKDGPVYGPQNEDEDDGNYSQFDVTIKQVDVSLSFAKWFNGKGLLRDVSIVGVRGVLDRTSVQPRKPDDPPPEAYRHEHNTGDFEIDKFKMEDVLLTVHQPRNFRPFQVSLSMCELPRLRKQWLFYDFLCANHMSGQFDNAMFNVHPRQVHGTTGVPLVDGVEEDQSQWKKHTRIELRGLNIDHLNRGVEGPFSWIQEGNVDIVSDVMLPHDADGSIAKVMSDFYDRMEATVSSQALQAQQGASGSNPLDENHNRFIVFDINIHLNDVRASVPIFTRDLSYVNNAAVRPIVAYINSHSRGSSNYIPISCRIVKRLSEFDGSWTVFDSGLLDDLSRETYEAFVRDIGDHKQRNRRIRKVSLWATQVVAQALFLGLAGHLV